MTRITDTHFLILYQYLQQFMPLSKETFEQLKGFFVVRDFPKKTIITKTGEVEDYFNVVAKGVVRKYIVADKREVTLQLATEGHLVHAEISFNTRRPSDCYIETIEPTILISLSYQQLQTIYEKFPEVEKLGRLIIADMFIRKDRRDMFQLRHSTRERFIHYMRNHPDMLQRIPQKYLASYLNIKPETFSRLKHLLKHK